MKTTSLTNTALAIFVCLLGLLAFGEAAPASSDARALSLRDAPAPKHAELLIAGLVEDVAAVDKKYAALTKATYGDIKAYSAEVKALVLGTIGQCSGKGKCDILDLDSLCKQLAILLSGIDLSLLSLSGKCYPLLGLGGQLIVLLLKLLCGDLIATLLALLNSLLGLYGGGNLLGVLSLLLGGNLGLLGPLGLGGLLPGIL